MSDEWNEDLNNYVIRVAAMSALRLSRELAWLEQKISKLESKHQIALAVEHREPTLDKSDDDSL
jgi:cell division protein ZapA (FtsZ GTPase activity inhibitor)